MAGPADWGAVPAQAPVAAEGPAAWGAVPVDTGPSVTQDVTNTALPSMERGLMAAFTAPATLADMAKRGIDYVAGKYIPGYTQTVGDIDKKIAENKTIPTPTYGNLQGEVEKHTGPLYEAKTPVGKAAQTALEVAPSILGGGGTLAQKGLQIAGTTAGNKVGEDVGAAFGHPEAGAFIGTLLGSVAPRVATPFPQPSVRYGRDVSTLEDAGVPLTPARRTGSPLLSKVESALGPNVDEEGAFTKAAVKSTGSSAANPQDVVNLPGGGQGNALAAQKQALSNGYQSFFGNRQIPYGNLSNDVAGIVQAYKHTAGADALPVVEEMANKITLGKSGQPMQNAQVAGMDGARYQLLKDRFETAIAGASGPEKDALVKMRNAMDQALQNSMTPQEQEAFQTLNRQYANLNTVTKAKQGPGGTITPESLEAGAVKRSGTEAHNLGKSGEAGDLARAGKNVLTEKPSFSPNTGAAAGALFGAGVGVPTYVATGGLEPALSAGILGSIIGHNVGHLAGGLLKPVARGVYYNPMVQALIGNQAFSGKMDPNTVVKLLATRPVMNALPQPTQ